MYLQDFRDTIAKAVKEVAGKANCMILYKNKKCFEGERQTFGRYQLKIENFPHYY